MLAAYNGKDRPDPAEDADGWKMVAQPKLVRATPVGGVARSKYSKRPGIRRSGTYRALFNPADGARPANTSPNLRLIQFSDS